MRTQVVRGEGYNELSFDDAKGAEQVRLHAHRDLEVRARREHGLSVGASRRTTIGGDDSCEVGGAVHGRRSWVGAESLHVGGSVAWTVDGAPGVEGVSPGMSVRVVAGGYEVSAPERIVLEVRCDEFGADADGDSNGRAGDDRRVRRRGDGRDQSGRGELAGAGVVAGQRGGRSSGSVPRRR